MKTAIFGTDLSAASDRIIENSTDFKLFGINRIILVYVLNLRSTMDFADYNLNAAQEKLDDQKNRLLSLGFESETRIVMGIPANELMRQVKIHDAGLIIIGSRGHSWSKPTLGETASEVLHNIKCPVLLMAFSKVPEEKQLEETMHEDHHHYEKFIKRFRKQAPKIELMHKSLNPHVLFATDFSDFSDNAFQWFKNQLTQVPKLTLMHIQDVVRIAKHLEDKLEEFNQIDTARLERLKEEFRTVHPETEIQIVLEYGKPKELIARFIEENHVSLTVMGSQGRGYIAEFFLGSVSLRVARLAASNVLIIPFIRKL
ncbi:MAG: universal stress protein [Bacteroidales bacterium]|jgi:nucleotide-binding universal stress UspA family protein